jgi:hypothetical protein
MFFLVAAVIKKHYLIYNGKFSAAYLQQSDMVSFCDRFSSGVLAPSGVRP